MPPMTTTLSGPAPRSEPTMNEETATALLTVRGLTKRYGTLTALDNLDLELVPGQVVGLLGENGCGKTTLLKILAGVLTGYEGSVQIAGHTPGPESKALVSFLPDASFLADSARVSDCLRLYADFFPDFQIDKSRELISFFGLSEKQRLREMSKGMREKVQISLAMSRQARLFLLDEPISGVDPAARQVILDGIMSNLEPDSLLIISTHLVHDLEPLLDAVVMMRHGQVLLTGSADDLRAEHGASLDAIFKETYR